MFANRTFEQATLFLFDNHPRCRFNPQNSTQHARMRQPNTTQTGHSFTVEWVNAVWQRGAIVPGYDASQVRKDACGAWILRSNYGTMTDYGWEIDHIVPVAKGGLDVVGNLQPLQWRNNRYKSDNYPNWTCALRAAA